MWIQSRQNKLNGVYIQGLVLDMKPDMVSCHQLSRQMEKQEDNDGDDDDDDDDDDHGDCNAHDAKNAAAHHDGDDD